MFVKYQCYTNLGRMGRGDIYDFIIVIWIACDSIRQKNTHEIVREGVVKFLSQNYL